jgi:hypothetical protein
MALVFRQALPLMTLTLLALSIILVTHDVTPRRGEYPRLICRAYSGVVHAKRGR